MSNNPWSLSGLLSPDLTNDHKGIGAQFVRFLRNVELTSSQKEAATTRHTAIRSWLQIEFPGSKTFIVGSYAKNTSIRPPSDLDIFLCLPDSIFTKYNSFAYTHTASVFSGGGLSFNHCRVLSGDSQRIVSSKSGIIVF